jgi:DNA-binding LacI/PurR family transcriptional regulator
MKKLTGIRMMAERLGVSTATISRALHPDTCHTVKEGRRREIIELADKLRYRPNPGARMLQKGLNPTVCVLIPRQEGVFFSEFYGRILGGVIHAVEGTKWEVGISTVNMEGKNALDEFRRIRIGSSAIIYAGRPLTAAQVDELSGYHSPAVLLSSSLPPDYPAENTGCHVLGVDNFSGAISAVNYMVEFRHTRIGVILGPSDSRDFAERERGYREGLARAGIELKESMFFNGSYDHESGRVGCEYFMAQEPRPTALICASDSIAFGAMDQAKEQGITCPRDLSIIGFDDGPWATACSPKLTTVRQPLQKLADRALALLTSSMMSSEANHRERIFLATSLNVRESTSLAKG